VRRAQNVQFWLALLARCTSQRVGRGHSLHGARCMNLYGLVIDTQAGVLHDDRREEL